MMIPRIVKLAAVLNSSASVQKLLKYQFLTIQEGAKMVVVILLYAQGNFFYKVNARTA